MQFTYSIAIFILILGLEYINYTTHFSLHDSLVIDISIMKGSIFLKYHICWAWPNYQFTREEITCLLQFV